MWRADAAWECAGWDQADLLPVLIVSDSPRVPPDPSMPPPPSLKHNIIMLRNTAAGTSSIALFISPQIRKISFLLTSSPLTLCCFSALWALWSLPDTWCCFCTCAVFSAVHFHFDLLVFEPQQLTLFLPNWLCTEPPFLDALHPLLFPMYLSTLPSVGNSVCDSHVM